MLCIIFFLFDFLKFMCLHYIFRSSIAVEQFWWVSFFLYLYVIENFH